MPVAALMLTRVAAPTRVDHGVGHHLVGDHGGAEVAIDEVVVGGGAEPDERPELGRLDATDERDHAVGRPDLVGGIAHDLGERGEITAVAGEGHGAMALGAQAGGQVVEAPLVDVDEHGGGAGLGHRERDGRADRARGAGDHDGASRDVQPIGDHVAPSPDGQLTPHLSNCQCCPSILIDRGGARS